MITFQEIGTKHAKYWMNEMRAIITLAEMNRPMTITEIWKSGPKLTALSTGGEKKFNKPGLTSACKRLRELGILEIASDVIGWQANRTHYRIRPSIDTLSLIDERLGSSVLSIVRQGAFGKAVISSDSTQYLLRRLVGTKLLDERRRRGEPDPLLPEMDVRDIEFLGKASTLALEVLTDPHCILYETPESGGMHLDLSVKVRRLRDVMAMALLFDLQKSHSLRLAAEGISLASCYDFTLTIGTETHRFQSSFDSKKLLIEIGGARERRAKWAKSSRSEGTITKESGTREGQKQESGKEE